jgi:hypothetical protein
MNDGSDDNKLAGDLIDVHGREAATVARENARAAALAGQPTPSEKLDPGARDRSEAASGQSADYSDLAGVISSVTTVKLLSVFGPKVVLIATSAASRPRAISTRPMRGMLWRASNVYHRPPR